MSKRTDTRFWISIFAPAIVLPMAAIAIIASWLVRLDLPRPAAAALKPAMLAVGHPIAPVRAQAEASVMPLPKATAEPAAPPPAARILDASTAESAGTYLEPATGSLSPQTAGVAETATPQPDAKVSDRVSVLSVIAKPEVAPPMARDIHSDYDDPARHALPPTSPIISTELAAPEPSRLIDGPIPLPKLRPHITIAYGNRTLPLPRPRPVENGSP